MYTSDKKILELAEILKANQQISTDKEFCEILEIDPRNYVKVKKGEKYSQRYHLTPLHIENVCKKLGIDANWIFDLSTEIYLNKKSTIKSTLTTKKTKKQTENKI